MNSESYSVLSDVMTSVFRPDMTFTLDWVLNTSAEYQNSLSPELGDNTKQKQSATVTTVTALVDSLA